MSPRTRTILAVACGCALALAVGAVPSSLAAAPARGPPVGSAPACPLARRVLGQLPGRDADADRGRAAAVRPRRRSSQFATAVSTPGSSLYRRLHHPHAVRHALRRDRRPDRGGRGLAARARPVARDGQRQPPFDSGQRDRRPAAAGVLGHACTRRPAERHARRSSTAPPRCSTPTSPGLVQGIEGLSTLSAPHPLIERAQLRRRSPTRVGRRTRRDTSRPAARSRAPPPRPPRRARARTPPTRSPPRTGSRVSIRPATRGRPDGRGLRARALCAERHRRLPGLLRDACLGLGRPRRRRRRQRLGQGEAALDIEQVIGLAPRANVLVYEGPNSNSGAPGAGPYDTWSAIISQDRARVVSASWGQCEALEGADRRDR